MLHIGTCQTDLENNFINITNITFLHVVGSLHGIVINTPHFLHLASKNGKCVQLLTKKCANLHGKTRYKQK